MIISDLQFYDISWKHRFESLSLRKTKGNELETNELPFNFAKIMDAEWTKKISRYNQHSAKELW